VKKSAAKRSEMAKLRNEARRKLSPEEQIEKLDKKLGAGKGAVRERARLNKLILNEGA